MRLLVGFHYELTTQTRVQGQTAASCPNHLNQLHVALPSKEGHTRLLYRMSMDFMPWVQHLPGIKQFWRYIAGQVRDRWVLLCRWMMCL